MLLEAAAVNAAQAHMTSENRLVSTSADRPAARRQTTAAADTGRNTIQTNGPNGQFQSLRYRARRSAAILARSARACLSG